MPVAREFLSQTGLTQCINPVCNTADPYAHPCRIGRYQSHWAAVTKWQKMTSAVSHIVTRNFLIVKCRRVVFSDTDTIFLQELWSFVTIASQLAEDERLKSAPPLLHIRRSPRFPAHGSRGFLRHIYSPTIA